ncbi:ABC transporter permease [Lacisediminimonas profundi]|uniref:ABC transporter permease n=1 Tax=Lacisediminimonas profundi TaxID=2603856 RepID=UPI00124AFE46|nr:ABC transporter permease [Lacisediminimonas profundi]
MSRISKTSERLIALASPLALLLAWEVAARTGGIDTRFFPAPTVIGQKALTMAASGELWEHLSASLLRLLLGSLLGGIPALALGILMGLYRPIRVAIDPLIAATYPIPKSAILPLILLIFGLGESSKIVMVALGVFFPVVINTLTGVLQIDRIYLDVGKNFGASRWQTFRTIALPGAMPSIMAGIKLGVGMGLILIAIAEMVGAKTGIGFMIWDAWQVLSVEIMYVGLVMIAILGFLITLLLNEVEMLVLPWRRDR